MSAVREAWTDERLDDLTKHVDQGFERVDKSFERVDTEIRQLRSDMNAGFDAIDARFDGLQRTLLLWGGSLTVAVLAITIFSHL